MATVPLLVISNGPFKRSWLINAKLNCNDYNPLVRFGEHGGQISRNVGQLESTGVYTVKRTGVPI